MPKSKELDYAAAKRIVDAIVSKAMEDGGDPVAAAVVDSHGDLLCYARLPGTVKRAYECAINKAFTSAFMGVDTIDLPENLKKRGWSPSDLHALHPDVADRLSILKGGVVVKTGDGSIMGGVAVAGRAGEEDHKLVQVGLKAIVNKP